MLSSQGLELYIMFLAFCLHVYLFPTPVISETSWDGLQTYISGRGQLDITSQVFNHNLQIHMQIMTYKCVIGKNEVLKST